MFRAKLENENMFNKVTSHLRPGGVLTSWSHMLTDISAVIISYQDVERHKLPEHQLRQLIS